MSHTFVLQMSRTNLSSASLYQYGGQSLGIVGIGGGCMDSIHLTHKQACKPSPHMNKHSGFLYVFISKWRFKTTSVQEQSQKDRNIFV